MILTEEINENYEFKNPVTIRAEQADNGIRIIIKDRDNKVFFFLSAICMSINKTDDELDNYGLLVTNFEYAPCVKDKPIFNDALIIFVNYANYAMFVAENGEIKARYKYVWTKCNANEKCEFAESVGLIPFGNEADLLIYKGELENQDA